MDAGIVMAIEYPSTTEYGRIEERAKKTKPSRIQKSLRLVRFTIPT